MVWASITGSGGEKIVKGWGQDYTFYLSNIGSTTLPAAVRVYLHGRTDDVSSPDHRTRVTLNGTTLGDVVWDGQSLSLMLTRDS